MRPRRSRSLLLRAAVSVALAAGAAVAALPSHGSSQELAKEGALFLLVPVGARAVGLGQAVSASRLGAEGIWWNPAALGWAARRELSVDHAKNFLVTGDAVDAVFPAGRAGVLSAALLYFNFGDQAATDPFGATIGTLYSRAIVVAASYAATFGDRVSAGLTYKYVQQNQSCGGSCQNLLTFSVSTTAFDVGVHAVMGEARALTIGAAVRNAGFRLQTIDTEQTDPLPTRLHAGVDYRVDALTRTTPGAILHLTGEFVGRPTFGDIAFHTGAELGWEEKVFIRGGVFTGSGDGSKGAVGFGFRQGTLGLDFARTFGGLSADAGDPPTYITLRVTFR